MGGAVEHTLSLFVTYKNFVAHNRLEGRHVDVSRSVIKMHGHNFAPFTETYASFATRYVVIANNTLGHAEDMSQWILQLSPQDRMRQEGIEDVIVENNRFIHNANTVRDVVMVGRRMGTRGNTAVNAQGASAPFWVEGGTAGGVLNYSTPAEWQGPYYIN
jgi:hypothetical protein